MTADSTEDKPSISSRIKHDLSYAKDSLSGIPFYKLPLLPFVFLIGTIKEALDAIKEHEESRPFVASIKAKYRIDEVNLDAIGCKADIKNVFQSQLVVMTVEDKDYIFLLEWDSETKEPHLSPAPVVDESLPYQPYPGEIKDLLK